MLEIRDQVSREHRELKSNGATRSSRTRTFLTEKKKKKKRLVMLLCGFYKNLLFLLSSSHLCLVARENRDKGIFNMPFTLELYPVNSVFWYYYASFLWKCMKEISTFRF